MIKKKYHIISIFSVFIIFGLYTKFYSNSNIFDYWLLDKIRTQINPNYFFILLTKIGDINSYFIIFTPVSIYLYWKKKNSLLFAIIFSILLSTFFMVVFKNIFQRTRPEEFFYLQQGGYSYPSGHSLVSSATYWTIYKISKLKELKAIYKYIFLILPFLIGFSRLVLGVHWPTDVIMGFLIGLSITWISIYIFLEKKENND